MVQIGVQRIDRFLFLSELDGVEVSFFFFHFSFALMSYMRWIKDYTM